MRPDFARGDPGFDQLLLIAPTDMNLRFEGLYSVAAGETAGPALAADVVPTSGDSLQVAFAPLGPNSGVEAVRLDFSTALFSTGAVMQASLQHSELGGWGLAAG